MQTEEEIPKKERAVENIQIAVTPALRNYFTTDDKKPKNEENRGKKMGSEMEEGEDVERRKQEIVREERQNGEKGNENEADTVADEV